MFQFPKHCQVDECNRAASANCFCCNKNVCIRHFTEHATAIKAQIDPLENDIQTMVEKVQTLTIEQITEPSFIQLHQWKADMHQLIDEIFSTKNKAMKELIEQNTDKFIDHKKQQSEIMMKIQGEVRQFREDGDPAHEQIESLRNRLMDVESKLATFGKDFICITTQAIAQDLVTVSSNLNTFTPTPPPPPPSMQMPETGITSLQFSGGTTTGLFSSYPPTNSTISNSSFGSASHAASGFSFGLPSTSTFTPTTSAPSLFSIKATSKNPFSIGDEQGASSINFNNRRSAARAMRNLDSLKLQGSENS